MLVKRDIEPSDANMALCNYRTAISIVQLSIIEAGAHPIMSPAKGQITQNILWQRIVHVINDVKVE